MGRRELTWLGEMRGEDEKQSSILMLILPQTRVPNTHPLRGIKKLADEALEELSPAFDAMYAEGGRLSIPPKRLLQSVLPMALYSVRSERQFWGLLDCNLLFRWCLNMIEESFVPTVLSRTKGGTWGDQTFGAPDMGHPPCRAHTHPGLRTEESTFYAGSME